MRCRCERAYEDPRREREEADRVQVQMKKTKKRIFVWRWKQPVWWLPPFNKVRSRPISLSLPLSPSLVLSADENLAWWVSGNGGLESGVGGGVGLLERVIFFSSGVKGGRSCVQSSWQKALLCAAYADRGGSFVHRWRSHAWVCLRQGGKGGRRGEKSVGEGKRREGGVSLALSAITVSGGGWGTEKENQAVLALPGSYIRKEGPQVELRGYRH